MKSIQLLFLVVCFTFLNTSCVSTRVEASPYQDSIANLECRSQSNWSYWWGLKQKPVDANPETDNAICPCREAALSWVVVKTSFTDQLLSLVTVGIINHRTVSYGCARPQDGEGNLDN